MAGHATLAHGLMLKDKWPTLRAVAVEARFVLAQESKAAGFKRLLNISPAAFYRHSHVRIVASATAHPAAHNKLSRLQWIHRVSLERHTDGEYAHKQKLMTTHFFGFSIRPARIPQRCDIA